MLTCRMADRPGPAAGTPAGRKAIGRRNAPFPQHRNDAFRQSDRIRAQSSSRSIGSLGGVLAAYGVETGSGPNVLFTTWPDAPSRPMCLPFTVRSSPPALPMWTYTLF